MGVAACWKCGGVDGAQKLNSARPLPLVLFQACLNGRCSSL